MTDYLKMMKLFVDKLKNNIPLSDKEKEDLVKYAITIKVGNFISKYKLNLSSMQLYMKIHGIKEVPKCKFCNKNCKYISLTKGFLRQCGDNDCKHKLFIENNKNIKEEHRLMYDNYLKDNLEFYRNVTIPFIDPYDNCIVKNHRQFCLKSASSLDILTEKRKCIFCKKDYDYNKFKYNKCFCKSCFKGHNYKYLEIYKDYSEIDFEIFKLNLRKKKFTNDNLLELSKKYNTEQLYKLLTDNGIIYNGLFLQRASSKDKYRYLFNNIIEDDMYGICQNCGKKYIKYDKVIENGVLTKIRINAEYSCGSKDCYYKCINNYEYKESTKLKQSKILKEKIKNGGYTPCVTNSWNRSRIFMLDNIKFRSSWDFLFYLICKDKNIKIEYEKIRIPYYDVKSKRNRIYITDFYDSKNKIIYEIKPESLENDLRNKNKFESAEKYAIENGMTFKIINEKYFKMCYNENIIDYVPNDLKNKCLQLWRQFE